MKKISKKNIVLPLCDIMINNQKRKLYGKKKNEVYLNNGDNIQLNIFNPLQERIGIQLDFNGEKEEELLIVYPGQKVILDRFISQRKKIQFKTYFVDENNQQAKDAIEKNGKMIIYFWSESKRPVWNNGTHLSDFFEKSVFNLNDKLSDTFDTFGTSDNSGTSDVSSISCNSVSNTTSKSSFPFTTESDSISKKSTGVNVIEELETGRIEKGGISEQNLEEVDFIRNFIFYELEYKLLPYSTSPESVHAKNMTSTELANFFGKETENIVYTKDCKNVDNNTMRIYCSSCGYRVRNRNWIYCPVCGKKIF